MNINDESFSFQNEFFLQPDTPASTQIHTNAHKQHTPARQHLNFFSGLQNTYHQLTPATPQQHLPADVQRALVVLQANRYLPPAQSPLPLSSPLRPPPLGDFIIASSSTTNIDSTSSNASTASTEANNRNLTAENYTADMLFDIIRKVAETSVVKFGISRDLHRPMLRIPPQYSKEFYTWSRQVISAVGRELLERT
jgi:hypothetical protein